MKDNSLLEEKRIEIVKKWCMQYLKMPSASMIDGALREFQYFIASHSSTSYNQWPSEEEITEVVNKKYPEHVLAAGPRRSGFIDGVNWLKQKLSESTNKDGEKVSPAEIMCILFEGHSDYYSWTNCIEAMELYRSYNFKSLPSSKSEESSQPSKPAGEGNLPDPSRAKIGEPAYYDYPPEAVEAAVEYCKKNNLIYATEVVAYINGWVDKPSPNH